MVNCNGIQKYFSENVVSVRKAIIAYFRRNDGWMLPFCAVLGGFSRFFPSSCMLETMMRAKGSIRKHICSRNFMVPSSSEL